MKPYIIFLPYLGHVTLVKFHNEHFVDKKVEYAFCHTQGSGTELAIHVELSSPETTYLTLLVPGLKMHTIPQGEDAHSFLETNFAFNLVSYFRLHEGNTIIQNRSFVWT